MSDYCVHCGLPVRLLRDTDFPAWVHDGYPNRRVSLRCPDNSGRIACPPQAGFE